MSDAGAGGVSIITLEEGWTEDIKGKTLTKLESYLENGFEGTTRLFDNVDYMRTYT